MLSRFYFLTLVLLTLTGASLRILFAVVHHQHFFAIENQEWLVALLYGLRFDLSIAAILTTLPLLFTWLILRLGISIRIYALTLLPLWVLVSLQSSDIMYFAESNRHLGYEIKDLFASWDSLLITAFQQNPVLSLSIPFFILLSLGVLFKKTKKLPKKKYGLGLEAQLFILLCLNVIFVRGGLQQAPLTPFQAYDLTDKPQMASVILNGAYNAVSSLSYKGIQKHKTFEFDSTTQTKLLKEKYSRRQPIKNQFSTVSNKNYNIVMIFLESWSTHLMYEGKNVYTPYFDSLKRKSLQTVEMIANGKRTTEGLFSTLCSAQNPLGQTVVNSYLQDHQFKCLPQILKNNGWSTAFFQGTIKNTSNVGTFSQRLGFEKSYGKEEISPIKYGYNDWGTYDQDIYGFALSKLKQDIQEPFFIGINTNTTHSLILPKNIKPLLPAKDLNSKRRNALFFADQALKEFMESSLLKNLKNPTLFILIADHTSGGHKETLANFSIPFLIHTPNHTQLRASLPISASQRDVAPTALDLLQKSIPLAFSGRSLLRPSYRGVDYYQNGFLGWISGSQRVEVRLKDRFLHKCYKRNNENWTEQTCDDSYQEIADEGIAFTKYSQDLLFSDQLSNFGHF